MMMMKFLRNNLMVILFFISTVMVLAISVYTSVMINSISVFLESSIEEHLLAVSRSAVYIATEKEIASLATPEDMEKPLYADIKRRLANFAEESNVMYAYYLRGVGDNLVQFIVDNDFTDETVDLSTAPIPAEKAPKEALAGRISTTGLKSYSPGFEHLFSAFAPVFDEDGNVTAVVGIDIGDHQVISTRDQIRDYIVMLISGVAIVIVSGFFSLFLYRGKGNSLQKRLEQQELMADISQSFISVDNMSTLIHDALRQMGEFVGIQRILIAVADKNNNESHPVYFWFSSDEFMPTPSKTGFNDFINSAFPKTLAGQKNVPPIYCNNIQTDYEGKYKIFEIAGLKGFIWAPIYVHGEFWGILSIEECVKARVWNESDKQLVHMVGSTIAGAVARDLMEKERAEALLQAKNANQAKSDFLSNMSHEMRTPMNAIIGMTSIAKGTEDVERKNYCLGKINDASNHLLGVINDILDMSKIEANKLELSIERFSFEKMLQKVVNVINFRVGERHQTLKVHIGKDIPRLLLGDDQRLAQVITNLLSNAVKFTPEQGTIRLDTRLETMDEDGLCTIKIEVIDNGIGISKEQQARLFSSFEQADSSTSRKFGGTGLGLAISKRIVEMMGGRIWIESELGEGATFAFTIQAQKCADDEKFGDSLLPGVSWDTVRVLVVDDEPEIREYFKEVSERFGMACDTAGSGAEAQAMIERSGAYDLYFVDWRMPIMNGIELSRLIKGREKDKSVVIMISATEWSTIEDSAKEAGVDKFLPKPLFPSAICDCVNECLGTGNSMPDDTQTNDNDCFAGCAVILAEDVEINREIVLTLLEPTSLRIECAENGEEALRMFEAAPDRYNAILMDVQMPKMDGYEATRRIRALSVPAAASIPIIAMTANVFREDIERCLESGMNGHVGKPLDMEEVIATLRKYLLNAD